MKTNFANAASPESRRLAELEKKKAALDRELYDARESVARSAHAYDPAPGLWDAGPGNWEPAQPESDARPSPWDEAADKYHPGRVVKGKVTRLADFGAFVELEPAIEGLIHISELAPQRVHRVKDIVQVGQEVQVMVLSFDPANRRISLSLKAALKAAEEEAPAEEEEDEEEYVPPPPRVRTTPLRGGIGSATPLVNPPPAEPGQS